MFRNLALTFLVLLLALLSGCNFGGTAAVVEPTAVPLVTPTPTGPAVFKVGVNAQYAPFAFVDDKGQVVGFDIDLMTAVVKAAGFQVEFVDSAWGVLFRALDQGEFGKFEAIIASISITPEKQQKVSFSQPYFRAGQMMVVKKGSPWQRPDQLTGQRLGVLENTTGQQWAAQNTGAEVVPFTDIDQAFAALAKDEVSAVINDGPNSAYFINNNPDLGLTLVGQPLTEESYGIAVSKDNTGLLTALDAGLATVIASGEYAQTCAKWFGTAESCLPPSIVTPENLPSETPLAGVSPTPSQPVPSVESPTTAPPPARVDSPKAVLPVLSCEVAPSPNEQAGRTYQIQAGDWLSSIAEREYGNPLDYRPIVAYTNQLCQNDQNLTCLENPDQIAVGWTIYLPAPDEVAAYWNGQLVSLPPLNFAASGDVTITGSSTVYPLTRQLAACFQERGFPGQINLDSTGTLAGFTALCSGQADIANASHAMRPEDRKLCQDNGYEPVELLVSTDALAVVVSRKNDFAGDVTLDELKQILSTAVNWSDVRPEWPAQPIQRFFPTEQSGTFLFMMEQLFAGNADVLRQVANATTSEDDEQLVQRIQNDPLAVGFFGYAYYKRNADTLQALPINGIRPLPETVDRQTYPLVRPLFLYSTTSLVKQKPQVAAFLNYYLQSVRNYVIQVGYFLPDEAAFQAAIQNFYQAVNE